MRKLKSITELDALVEKHSPSFPKRLKDVGNLHPSHAERRANAQALKPSLLRFHAIRQELTNHPELDTILEDACLALENAVNRGESFRFNQALKTYTKRLTRAVEEPFSGEPNYKLGDALQDNIYLISKESRAIYPVRPEADQLQQPSHQMQF